MEEADDMSKNIKTLLVLSVCLALGVLAQAQDNAGFINIDCGASSEYTDGDLGIKYTTDAGFIASGENMQISSQYRSQAVYQLLMNLRAFPNGTRNCYTLNPTQGKNNKYLIRASFYYGNYDGKSLVPTFDLHIDTNNWTSVSSSNYTYEEIIYTPSRDYVQVCLVNRGTGTPFISALELRLLDNSTYATPSGALVLYERDNLGSPTQYRYPQDAYDRIWQGLLVSNGLFPITTTTTFKSTDAYTVPTQVLMTAERTTNSSFYFYKWWTPLAPTNLTTKWYIYFYFAEIQVLQSGQVRAFQVYAQNNLLTTVTPEYLKPVTVISPPVNGSIIMINISSTSGSNLPPFINALEAFYVLDLPNSQTDFNDVTAVNAIKSTYGVTKDSWQGDPCVSKAFAWSGLSCSNDNFPRITSLNLSSSGLTGKIAPAFSNLTALVSLDLSFNQLSGQLPEYFAQMQSLRVLNLAGNNLTGAIPATVQDRMTAGTLQITLDSNPICQASSCPSSGSTTKKKSVVLPIVIAVVASIILLVLVTLVVCYIRSRKRRQGRVNGSRPTEVSRKNEDEIPGIGQITRAFSSAEVSNITNNFDVTIGEGGFGNVFLGTLSDGTKVAVKVLSQSSRQGYKEFQAEAQLLMIVHHKNLVSLLGYCDDIENMALIYELMPHGNLRQHLSEYSVDVLRWNQRLQIAVDAAQGLEYLHNGCKPPIIHRDLKTSNILLDENMQAKIADFGLSRLFKPENDSYISTRPAGTPGYLDPVFHTTGNLNRTSDIYSFGIILFELITGHPAIIRNPKSSMHIVQWVTPLIEGGDVQSISDPRMHGQFNSNSVWKVIEIALQCVHLDATQRPDINSILSELKASLAMELNSERTVGNYPKSTSFEMNSLEFESAPASR